MRALEGLCYESAMGDVLDYRALLDAMRGVDIVFHAAAVAEYWRSGVASLYKINVDGTRNVLQAALEAGVRRVVYTSSVASLGIPAFGTTRDENDLFNLKPEQFHYGYSKVLAEQAVQEYIQRGLDVVIVNPAVVIGPRDVNVISGSIIVEIARRDMPVYPPGGVCVIDVADVCAAHLAAAEVGRPGERYILGGENLWHKELAAITARVVGRSAPRIALSRPVTRMLAKVVDAVRKVGVRLPVNGDQLRFSAETLWFNSDKARRELGLTTRSYAEMAQRAYDWYREKRYL